MATSLSRLPRPTASDLCAAAADDFARQGYTTSLDLKTGLRARGFWATQAFVSCALQAIADEFDWAWCPCETLVVTAVHEGDRCRRSAERQGPYLAYWPADEPPPPVLWGVG